MRITIYRKPQESQSTPGELGINGVFECYSLEPLASGVDHPRIAAGGPWPIKLLPSPKFQALALEDAWYKPFCDAMPHIMFEPDSVTMLHPGNAARDTHDCILVGQDRYPNLIGGSRLAFAALYQKIVKALAEEGCDIEVLDAPTNAEDVQETHDA